MNPIEKAERTLDLLSSSGKLTLEQCDRFIEYASMPMPPIRFFPWWHIWRYPVYWYQQVMFRIYNRQWEKETERENPYRQGIKVVSISQKTLNKIEGRIK
jgi:hypothetical protein